jgi:hypothetical protein
LRRNDECDGLRGNDECDGLRRNDEWDVFQPMTDVCASLQTR